MVYGLGERLQSQRFSRNISQKQAALGIGVSASVISNYESGERTPSVEKLMALASLYRCSVDYLLGIEKLIPLKLILQCLMIHKYMSYKIFFTVLQNNNL